MGNQITKNETIQKYFPGIRTVDELPQLEVVPTGLPSLDNIVLGCGGLPRGRSIELYAKPTIGKTTLAINLIAKFLARKLSCCWDDREGTFPGPEYTDPIGLDRGNLVMVDSADGNDALDKCKLMIALNIIDLYVIDSLGAIIPRTASISAVENDLNMHKKLQRAALLTEFFGMLRSGYYIGEPGSLKKDGTYNKGDLIESDKTYVINGKEDKFLHKLSDKKTILLLINHEKAKVGSSFGVDYTTSGGDSGKFDASIRLRIKHIKNSAKKDKFGSPEFKVINIRADKNKCAPPFRSADFKMMRNGIIMEMEGNEAVEVVSDSDQIEPIQFKMGGK